MKKFILLNVFALFLLSASFAQSIPRGMKYQAVARDTKGQVLANQSISLKITLLSQANGTASYYYSEVHNVVTNELGLFTLVIGEGDKETGDFTTVPWSTQDIWMKVSIKESSNADFTEISNSKLLAVPYAYYAATASELVGPSSSATGDNTTTGTSAGIPSQSWSLFGNSESDPTKDKLGTTDAADLVLVTNNIERLRIYSNGNIRIKRSLGVGADLVVDSSVYLNHISGQTINYGDFTVSKQSKTRLTGPLTVDSLAPTLMSGTLTVDKETHLNSSLNVDGPTDLDSRLNVNEKSPTTLTGLLHVQGITDLDSSLNVNHGNPTVLSGRLRVDSNSIFNSLTNTDTTLASPNGALAIYGGVGIDKGLTIGGDVKIGGNTSFSGPLHVNDPTESVSTSTGAVIVKGGVGIAKKITVGGAANLLDSLNILGITTLKNETQSSATSSGSLVVNGGAGIAKNVNIGGTLTTAGVATINNTLKVNASSNYVAEFTNSTDANGISIQVGTSSVKNSNNFVTFKNSSGSTVGRIEGETLDEMHNSETYKFDLASKVYDVTGGAIDLSLATANLAETISFQIEADASANACAGLGIVACPPIASFVAGSIAEVVVASVEEALVVGDIAFASTELALWKTNTDNNVGVTYESGAGDYAEYLRRQQPSEKISAGDIVGVTGGRISKNTTGAEKLMVVSSKPIVLGNTPEEGAENNFNPVAFMGQVPVTVFGKVNLGDYIIPNGMNNGVGIAVSPDKITAKDIKNIVGIAWSTSDQSIGLSKVNVAIGLNVNDNQKLIDAQQKEIERLKNQIAQTNSQLEKLVPGFKAPAGNISADVAIENSNASRLIPAPDPATLGMEYPVNMNGQVKYYEVKRNDFENAFAIAEDKMLKMSNSEKYSEFWKKIDMNPQYKAKLIDKLMETYHKQLNAQKGVDARLNHY